MGQDKISALVNESTITSVYACTIAHIVIDVHHQSRELSSSLSGSAHDFCEAILGNVRDDVMGRILNHVSFVGRGLQNSFTGKASSICLLVTVEP